MIGEQECGGHCEGCDQCADQCSACMDIVPMRDMSGDICIDCERGMRHGQ